MRKKNLKFRSVLAGAIGITIVMIGLLAQPYLPALTDIFGRDQNAQASEFNPADEYFTLDPASDIPGCAGESECFAFTIDTRLDSNGDATGSSTEFAIPTSFHEEEYNWLIDWGDGSSVQSVSGTGSNNSSGISRVYSEPGEYQISIRPNGDIEGWFRAFGFWLSMDGANAETNKYKLKSINTPFSNNMRRVEDSISFQGMFLDTRNMVGIPGELFSLVDTAGISDFSGTFRQTFSSSSQNHTDAIIPMNLFDSINTASGTSFVEMFSNTFFDYAQTSSTGTIPSGLFSSLDTANGTNFSYMFINTFAGYAAFNSYATIPADLFSSLDTANGTNFYAMFSGTFFTYAFSSTTATVPSDLFDSLNTINGANLDHMFNNTFGYYATRQVQFVESNSGEILDTIHLPGPNIYSVKIGANGEPSDEPIMTAGAQAYPTYNSDVRTINPPAGDAIWHRTDGTSCSAAVPTADCGSQTSNTVVAFPNTTEWTPDTSTEKANVSFYSVYSAPAISDISLSEDSFSEGLDVGSDIGVFSVVSDANNSPFIYTLEADGDNNFDNSSFTISDSVLRLSAVADFATKPTYTINVRVTDTEGNTFSRPFTLSVTPARGSIQINGDVATNSFDYVYRVNAVASGPVRLWAVLNGEQVFELFFDQDRIVDIPLELRAGNNQLNIFLAEIMDSGEEQLISSESATVELEPVGLPDVPGVPDTGHFRLANTLVDTTSFWLIVGVVVLVLIDFVWLRRWSKISASSRKK